MEDNEIKKSFGLTSTEKLLADYCDKIFLKLWNYANPIKEDGKELCDLIAIFDGAVFLFLDRHNKAFEKDNALETNWNRWKSKAIDAQIRSIKGAERYLKSGGKIYVDKNKTTPVPFSEDISDFKFYRIIVAHGAEKVCLNEAGEISGSLSISYGDKRQLNKLNLPFLINLEKDEFIHILDGSSMTKVFYLLDTYRDLRDYLDEKQRVISERNFLMYTAEEDLVAQYFSNFDERNNKHYIKSKHTDADSLFDNEGFYHNFLNSYPYKIKKEADNISYLWDSIIQFACDFALDGSLEGDNLIEQQLHLTQMAKESRLSRRSISKQIAEAIHNYPSHNNDTFSRHIRCVHSEKKDVSYLFLQISPPKGTDPSEVLKLRKHMLTVACVNLNKYYPTTNIIIGIATNSIKYFGGNTFDFLHLDYTSLTKEFIDYYEAENQHFRFFETDNLTEGKTIENEFPK